MFCQKSFLILYPSLENSTTGIAIMDVDFKRPENLDRYLMMIDRGIYKTDKQHIQSAVKKMSKNVVLHFA